MIYHCVMFCVMFSCQISVQKARWMMLDLITVSKQPMILQPNQRSSPRSWKAKKLKKKAAWLCTVSSLKLGFLWNGGRMKRSWCLEKSTRWSRRPQWMNCWSAVWCQKTVETTAVCVESRRPPLVSTSRVGGGLQGFCSGDGLKRQQSYLSYICERLSIDVQVKKC